MSETVIEIKKISKQYHLGVISHRTLAKDISSFFQYFFKKIKLYSPINKISNTQNKNNKDCIWALKDINIRVKRGEIIGIIGKNGAGKSTLLKILSRITSPTFGTIKIKGRIASLLEVGTGFHPELTGKENIFLNGAILGMKKSEISNKLNDIIEFSGVRKFINTPTKRYSSGMRLRLAFAIAAHLDADILLIDEVLAVGDAEFQKKCLNKIDEVSKSGRTILFVSHQMPAVRTLCTKGVLLDNGSISLIGETNQVIDTYLHSTIKSQSETKSFGITQNEITLNKISISKTNIVSGDSFDICFFLKKADNIKYLADITFHLIDEYGHLVFIGSSLKADKSIKVLNGSIKAICRIPENILNAGIYTISRLLFVKDQGTILFEIKDSFSIKVDPKIRGFGFMEEEEGIIDPYLEWEITFN